MNREDRIAIIDEVLIYHRNRKVGSDLVCSCGYKQRLGRSIMLHRAELIDSALMYAERGTF